MLLRIQSSEGTKRIEVTPGDSLQKVYQKACDAFGGLSIGDVKLYHDRLRKRSIISSQRKTVKGSKLGHGEMIYLLKCNEGVATSDLSMDIDKSAITGTKNKHLPEPSTSGSSPQPSTSSNNSSSKNGTNLSSNSNDSGRRTVLPVKEDCVDQFLHKEEGRIPGKRNPLLCHHKGNSRCIHCTDVDPWDEGYLKENNIKHMSFHTYTRMLKSGVDKGKFVQLSNLQCSIKTGCSDHPPWPQGICSSCQPSAITLTRQTFRHVDAVVFENRTIVENFLTYWRTTGHQRVGLLYGRHVVHKEVPLGIRAEVAAIYEPPQEATLDNIKLLPNPNKAMVDQVASELGLSCIGWVFTDLVPLDSSSGTVRHLRHSDTYFLSSHEVITAAEMQLQHPSPCVIAPASVYGSKFATVIVTGDANNQVHMEGYQVSHQCEALVSDGCLLPTLDAPELAYIRESSSKQYVPDVFFKEKDEYSNEVTRLGRPLPVEYLLLDLPVSTPNTPSHTFSERTENAFPIENRLVEGHLQDFSALAKHLGGLESDTSFLTAVSDFHVLLYLASMDVLPMRTEMQPLLYAVRDKNATEATSFRLTDTWSTLEQLLEAAPMSATSQISSNGVGNDTAGAAAGATWTCAHCTFINQGSSGAGVCDMCHLPR